MVALDLRIDYIREDIDYGMAILRDILRLAGAQTPTMDRILEWRQTLSGSRAAVGYDFRSNGVPAFATIDELASALD